MGLFNNYNEVEKKLLEHYTQFFSTMGLPDAKKTAKNMLDKAIESSKKQGTYDLPPNMGDIILGKANPKDIKSEKMAGYIRKYLSAKRKDGVKDEDILWWWNLYDVERNIMLAVDEFHRIALFIKVLQETGNDKEAGKQVWKHHPSYTAGDPKNEKLFIEGHTEKDLPLPIELKYRVNIYIEKMSQNPDVIKKNIEESSSFNALIRREISAGNL
jgi:hypothetical protein